MSYKVSHILDFDQYTPVVSFYVFFCTLLGTKCVSHLAHRESSSDSSPVIWQEYFTGYRGTQWLVLFWLKIALIFKIWIKLKPHCHQVVHTVVKSRTNPWPFYSQFLTPFIILYTVNISLNYNIPITLLGMIWDMVPLLTKLPKP